MEKFQDLKLSKVLLIFQLGFKRIAETLVVSLKIEMKFTVMRAHLLLLFQLDRPQANDRFYRVVFFHPGVESAQFFMAHHLIAEVVYFQKAQAMY